ncbi:flagellar biosynthesis regulator FlaF [Rhizobium laguerreae]|uniref:flagellar biosynthesis regulator FlaF n=1 Tax=Rhizobium laguerreae TaxID=1076926 RepID=UPI001C918F6B|nr:flagellar biosynthesis regulator FlaF [Rhizobium laguerreae]MBY3155485.1 flagellar biosynthesis regulator FlaF [Rhizobium laguerreae]
MYQFAYAEAMEDSLSDAQCREREAFDKSIALMRAAASQKRYSRLAIEAITYTQRLWSALIDDLSSPDNQLAEQVRANLISIGIWILAETDRIRKRLSANFQGIIEVTAAIRNGIA